MTAFFITWYGIAELLLFFFIILLCIKPLGTYIARVYNGQYTFLERFLGPIEDYFYRFIGVNETEEMTWQEYASALLIISFGSFLLLFSILKFQAILPFNPQKFDNLSSDLAFNVTISFITNTNWQSYSGENTLSYFSQMMGLTVQNFLSAAIGIAVAIVFIRGLTRKNTNFIGNFWVDLTRGCLYLLLPLAFILAIFLGTQGVIQNFNPYLTITPLEAPTDKFEYQIPGGPVASQVAIKILGTNGGGFFNANSSHPFENPNGLTNFIELIAILLIPTALCYTFSMIINNKKQGWVLLAAMFIIFLPLFLYSYYQEQRGNFLFPQEMVNQTLSILQPGGNMEGKEARFGILNSTLWASTTTATANGSVNSMHDSYTPLGGMIPLLFMLFGEIIFGGVGSGLFSILIFVFITVFISGLMIGRTPEFLGKKIQFFEIKMSILIILIPMFALLFGLMIAVLTQAGQAGIFNTGAQGFTELLYAFASSAGNNGSAFNGIHANTPFYNILLGLVMFFSRYWVMICILAIAGELAQKKISPIHEGTLATTNFLFLGFLIGVILLIGPLAYIPAMTLGPINEYFQWTQ